MLSFNPYHNLSNFFSQNKIFLYGIDTSNNKNLSLSE